MFKSFTSDTYFWLFVGFTGAFALLMVLVLYPKKIVKEAAQMKEKGFFSALIYLLLKRVEGLNKGLKLTGYKEKIEKKLIMAGEPGNLKPEGFIAFQEIAALFFLFFGLILANFINKTGMTIIIVPVFLLFGMVYPNIWLRDKIKKRHKRIFKELPYDLDLLTLSVEAGLDFNAAIGLVVEKGKKGPLNDELTLMLKRLKLGQTRQESLAIMMDRVNLPQLSTFISNLIQADKMGTSLGKILRIQAQQLRVERTQRAEKLASQATVKIIFPLVFCIFPTIFMILFGPIIYTLFIGKNY